MEDSLDKILVKGLTSSPKHIPTWYNYDDVGSQLEHKCVMENPGYYFTRSQMSVLQNNIQSILPSGPHQLTLVDLGSGNCSKTRPIIDELLKTQHNLAFYPVDISGDFLLKSMDELSKEYGKKVQITPIAADYMQGIKQLRGVDGPKLIMWFGSIINLPYDEQVNTLRLISTMMTAKCRLVFSADITQQRKTVLMAYHDKEAGLGINLSMKKGERLYFHEGVGFSCKYTLEQLRNIVEKAGLRLAETVTDEEQHAIFCHCTVA